MNDGLIPNRYAKALYLYATENGEADAVYEQMARLADSFATRKELTKVVENPFLPLAGKIDLLLTAAGAASGKSLDKFFRLVFSHRREALIQPMALAYGRKYRETHGISQVEIVTASPLPEKTMEELKTAVQSHLDGRKLEYRERVDGSLIGGFTVKVDSELLDASMKNELRKLRLKLLSRK